MLTCLQRRPAARRMNLCLCSFRPFSLISAVSCALPLPLAPPPLSLHPPPPTSLSLLEELDCSCNELEALPPTVGYLHSLRTFAADENFLTELPREVRPGAPSASAVDINRKQKVIEKKKIKWIVSTVTRLTESCSQTRYFLYS